MSLSDEPRDKDEEDDEDEDDEDEEEDEAEDEEPDYVCSECGEGLFITKSLKKYVRASGMTKENFICPNCAGEEAVTRRAKKAKS